MSRLTIIIPLFKDIPLEAFEETLASVLAHRPEGAEVLIANGTDYSDPWNTSNEGVVFLALTKFSNPIDILNEVVVQASGAVIHILWPGTEVTSGWCDTALAWFDDPETGIVVPSVFDRRKPKRVFSLGIHYKPEGVLRTIRRSHWIEASDKTIVPHISAVFFRTEAIRKAGLFDRTFIPQIAFADLAMAVSGMDWKIVVDRQCRILVRPNHLPATSAFTWGMQTERLYFRWFGKNGSLWTLGGHFASFGIDFWRHFPKLKCCQILTGRLLGLLCFGEMIPFVRRFHQERMRGDISEDARAVLTRLSTEEQDADESASPRKSA